MYSFPPAYRILQAEQVNTDQFLHPSLVPSLLPVVLVSHCQCMELASSPRTYQVADQSLRGHNRQSVTNKPNTVESGQVATCLKQPPPNCGDFLCSQMRSYICMSLLVASTFCNVAKEFGPKGGHFRQVTLYHYVK